MNNRIPYIDFAAGIMILWMIIYHALGQVWQYELMPYWGITDLSLIPETIRTKVLITPEGEFGCLNPCILFPYLHFFMPWFFYKSGQFFKKQSFNELIKKDYKKLLKTFIFWSLIGYICFLVFGLITESISLRSASYSVVRMLFLWGCVPLNYSLWFLLTLFFVRTIANLLLPLLSDKKSYIRISMICLGGYLLTLFLFQYNHRLIPLWVVNTISGLVFFTLGYALSKYERRWFLILISFILYISCLFVGFPMVDMKYNIQLSGSYWLWMPISLCCIIAFNAFCRFISRYIIILSKPIEILGCYAMPIYVTHRIVMAFVYFFIVEYFKIPISSNVLLLLILVAFGIFIPPLCLFMKTKWYKKIVC